MVSICKKFLDFAFSQHNDRNNNLLPLIEILRGNPNNSIKYIIEELKMALVYNFFSIILSLYIMTNASFYFSCHKLFFLWILIFFTINLLSTFPKILMIWKFTQKLNNQQILIQDFISLLNTNIYFINLKISKSIFFVYIIGFILKFFTYIYYKSILMICNNDKSFGIIITSFLVGFLIRFIMTIIKFKKLYHKNHGYGKIKDKIFNNLQTKNADITFVKENNENPCSICLENYKLTDEILYTNCNGNHFFHKSCIRKWFQNYSRCPLCNFKLN